MVQINTKGDIFVENKKKLIFKMRKLFNLIPSAHFMSVGATTVNQNRPPLENWMDPNLLMHIPANVYRVHDLWLLFVTPLKFKYNLKS